MKNFFQLLYVNIKRIGKDPNKIIFMCLMPFIVILFVHFGISNNEESGTFANDNIIYNVEDNGHIWKDVFPYLIHSEETFIKEKGKALELLENGKASVVYNIEEDFSEIISHYETPTITAYKIEEGNTTIPIEMKLNQNINQWIEKYYLIDKEIILNEKELSISKIKTILVKDGTKIDGDNNLITFMLIYFIILGSAFVGQDLIEFKQKGIILRTVSTPNKDRAILGSLITSILVFQVSINMIILFLGKMLLKYEVFHIHIIFINIIMASLFTITLSLASTRIFKNAGIASTMTSLFAVVSMFLSMFTQETFQNIPKFIRTLGKFTPHYWITDSLERSVLFPNVFILLLMVITLFTMGSYKLKDF